MASLSKNKAGNWRIQFVNERKERKTLWIGRVQERFARSVFRHVEELVEAISCRRPLIHETTVWLKGADPKLLEKLATQGLVERVAIIQKPTLTELADGYFAQEDIEDSTKSIRRYWLQSLIEVLGDKTCDQYTPEDGGKLRDRLLANGLAHDTVQRMLRFAQQLLLRAVPKHLPVSPFAKLRMNHRDNRMPSRDYISLEKFEEILSVLPPAWQMMAALGRLGGLRCPSEALLVRWKDVHLDEEYPSLDVTSPKTKSQGKPWRRVPISPRLAEILRELKPENCSGNDFLVDLPSYRTERQRGWHGVNTRQQFNNHLKSGGIGLIKSAFKVFRSSCMTDWAKKVQIHVVAKWAGNTAAVAAKHYLTLVDSDWKEGTTCTPVQNQMTTHAARAHTPETGSTLSCSKDLVVGQVIVEPSWTASQTPGIAPGEISAQVSQIVSHPVRKMGVMEGNLASAQNSEVVSRTGLTPQSDICPDIKNYPARIRT